MQCNGARKGIDRFQWPPLQLFLSSHLPGPGDMWTAPLQVAHSWQGPQSSVPTPTADRLGRLSFTISSLATSGPTSSHPIPFHPWCEGLPPPPLTTNNRHAWSEGQTARTEMAQQATSLWFNWQVLGHLWPQGVTGHPQVHVSWTASAK